MATLYALKKKKPQRKKHRLLIFMMMVLLLAVVSATAVVMVRNDGVISMEGFKQLLSNQTESDVPVEFSFEASADSVFAAMDDGLAVCSRNGLQVFDARAKKLYNEAFELKSPTICSNGSVSAVYDLGSSTLKVFDLSGVKTSMTTDDKIIAASMNKNGWLALCTQESGGYKASVSVYMKNTYDYDKYIYKWFSAEGYVVSAAVSPDNKSLAVLTLTGSGSRIVFFSLNSPDEKGSAAFPDEVILDIKYLSDGSVIAVNASAVRLIKPDGTIDVMRSYADKRLAHYALGSDSFTALAISDFMVGNQGRLITFDKSGKELGSIETNHKVIALSASGDYLAVLYSDAFVIYDKKLKEYTRLDETAGAEQTIMRPDRKALLITSHSATVYNATDH